MHAQLLSPAHARRVTTLLAGVVLTITLVGCADMSGLGAASKFNCHAPEGIPCMSVSGIDANQRAGTLPLLRPESALAMAAAAASASAPARPQGPQRLLPAGAIRSDPAVVRVWIAPWQDSDGDLNDEGYLYMQVDSGRWLIEHNRSRIQRAFAPAAAARESGSTAAAAAAPASAPAAAPARMPAVNRAMQQGPAAQSGGTR